jgi:hypothetical protein
LDVKWKGKLLDVRLEILLVNMMDILKVHEMMD